MEVIETPPRLNVISQQRSDSKQAPSDEKQAEAVTSKAEAASSAKDEKSVSDSSSDSKRERRVVKPLETSTQSVSAFPEPKPLTFGKKLLTPSKALPPIGSRTSADLSEITSELEDKRRQAEGTIRRSQEQLASQRSQEDELRKQLNQVNTHVFCVFCICQIFSISHN